MDLGPISELFLAHFLCSAQFLDIEADSILQTHAGRAEETAL